MNDKLEYDVEALVKVLCWTPVIGFFIEIFVCKNNYLSDVRHPIRFFLSTIWTGLAMSVSVFAVLKLLLK